MEQCSPIVSVIAHKPFEEAVLLLLRSIEKKGWSIFGIYDLQERLAAKGFVHPKTKVIELCAAKHADKVLKQSQLASLCMPCRINVIETPKGVQIVAMNPAILPTLFDTVSKESVVDVENDVREIIKGAVE